MPSPVPASGMTSREPTRSDPHRRVAEVVNRMAPGPNRVFGNRWTSGSRRMRASFANRRRLIVEAEPVPDWRQLMRPNRLFLLGFVMMSVVESAPMRLSPTILAVLAALAIVGCATKQDQITPAEAQTEKKDQQEYNKEVDSRIQ